MSWRLWAELMDASGVETVSGILRLSLGMRAWGTTSSNYGGPTTAMMMMIKQLLDKNN